MAKTPPSATGAASCGTGRPRRHSRGQAIAGMTNIATKISSCSSTTSDSATKTSKAVPAARPRPQGAAGSGQQHPRRPNRRQRKAIAPEKRCALSAICGGRCPWRCHPVLEQCADGADRARGVQMTARHRGGAGTSANASARRVPACPINPPARATHPISQPTQRKGDGSPSRCRAPPMPTRRHRRSARMARGNSFPIGDATVFGGLQPACLGSKVRVWLWRSRKRVGTIRAPARSPRPGDDSQRIIVPQPARDRPFCTSSSVTLRLRSR